MVSWSPLTSQIITYATMMRKNHHAHLAAAEAVRVWRFPVAEHVMFGDEPAEDDEQHQQHEKPCPCVPCPLHHNELERCLVRGHSRAACETHAGFHLPCLMMEWVAQQCRPHLLVVSIPLEVELQLVLLAVQLFRCQERVVAVEEQRD